MNTRLRDATTSIIISPTPTPTLPPHVTREQDSNTSGVLETSRTFATIIIIVIVTMSEGKREMTNDGFSDVIADRMRRLRRMKDQGRIRTLRTK